MSTSRESFLLANSCKTSTKVRLLKLKHASHLTIRYRDNVISPFERWCHASFLMSLLLIFDIFITPTPPLFSTLVLHLCFHSTGLRISNPFLNFYNHSSPFLPSCKVCVRFCFFFIFYPNKVLMLHVLLFHRKHSFGSWDITISIIFHLLVQRFNTFLIVVHII